MLTEAAIDGRGDNLVGLKENIIIGKLIPAGHRHAALPGVRRHGARLPADGVLLAPTRPTRPSGWPASPARSARAATATARRGRGAEAEPGSPSESGTDRHLCRPVPRFSALDRRGTDAGSRGRRRSPPLGAAFGWPASARRSLAGRRRATSVLGRPSPWCRRSSSRGGSAGTAVDACTPGARRSIRLLLALRGRARDRPRCSATGGQGVLDSTVAELAVLGTELRDASASVQPEMALAVASASSRRPPGRPRRRCRACLRRRATDRWNSALSTSRQPCLGPPALAARPLVLGVLPSRRRRWRASGSAPAARPGAADAVIAVGERRRRLARLPLGLPGRLTASRRAVVHARSSARCASGVGDYVLQSAAPVPAAWSLGDGDIVRRLRPR